MENKCMLMLGVLTLSVIIHNDCAVTGSTTNIQNAITNAAATPFISETKAARRSESLFLNAADHNNGTVVYGAAVPGMIIADKLNVSMEPYSDPLIVMVPAGKAFTNQIVTLKAVINKNIMHDDDKTAADVYDFQWVILMKPVDAERLTTLNQSANLAWLSLTHLVAGNYTVKLVVNRRANDAPARLRVNDSGSAGFGEHAALGEATKTIAVQKETAALLNSSYLSALNSPMASVNVSAFTNHPPIALISPGGVRRITKSGSPVVFMDMSKDNDPGDSVVERKWSVVQSPVGFAETFTNEAASTSQITLNNLPRGNYTFQLTVKDSHGAANSTFVKVIAEYEDRPPVAKVVGDIVLQLSNENPETNRVTLDGSQSSDDNGIIVYEWSRVNNLNEMLDVKGKDTPKLTVSGFQNAGDYIFNLTVKDASGQTDVHQVHVAVVKSEEDEPRAAVGEDVTVMAPVESVVLNGTLSKPVNKLTYKWTQAAGPSSVLIENFDQAVAHAKHFLIPGEYKFQLEVKHSINGKKSIVSFKVVVNQGKNKPPVADAGRDSQISLPFPVFSVNGSASGDDLGIEHFFWLLDDNNPAGATIVGNSQHEPVLVLRGLAAGVHKFYLTVADAQQLSSNASVTVEVLPDKFGLARLELVLKQSLQSLRQANINDVEHTLYLILSQQTEIDAANFSSRYYNVFIDAVEMDRSSSHTRIMFHVVEHISALPTTLTTEATLKSVSGKPLKDVVRVVDGPIIAGILQRHFRKRHAQKISGLDVLLVDTFVCQNPCSGHGDCNNVTKRCKCHIFWWPSPIRALIGDGQSNCDWSTFYVVLLAGFCALFVLLFGHVVVKQQASQLIKDLFRRLKNNSNVRNDEGDASKTFDAARPRRRRYRLLDSASPNSDTLPVNISSSNNNSYVRQRNNNNMINGAITVDVHGGDGRNTTPSPVENSLEMTQRQYYSGHRQQHQNRGAFNTAYSDDADDDDDDESDAETLYDATRRLVPQSSNRRQININAGDRRGIVGGGIGRSIQISSTSPVPPKVAAPSQSTWLSSNNSGRQSSGNLSGSHDSGLVLS